MFSKLYSILLVLVVSVSAVFAQEAEKPAAEPTPAPTPELSKDEVKGINLVESSLLVYSNLRGRQGLDQIRKTWVEFGNLEVFDQNGKSRKAKYEFRALRGDSLEKTKMRLDHRFPDARYAIVFDDGKVFGVFGTTRFEPDVATKDSFSNRIWRGLPALFRYKESEAKIEFVKDEKVMGVEYVVVRLTQKSGETTDYYMSKKTFRVMMVEYKHKGVDYRRKYYDYNYAQNTLFPYRTVLWANGKRVEEMRTQTVTFGQEFGQDYFDFSSIAR